MTVIRDPYAATFFEPECAACDDLWGDLLAAGDGVNWVEDSADVRERIREHAREVHQVIISAG